MKKLAIVLVFVLLLAATVTIISACSVKYDLLYANWNFGTDSDPSVERKMIKAFEDKYDVKIKTIDYGQDQAYPNGLLGAVQRQEAPDVFMVNNMSFVLTYQLAMDVSEFVAEDEDWQKIPQTVEQGAHFKDGIYAIPFALHMLGYFINEDLIEDCNLDSVLPQNRNEGITYTQFKELVSGISATPDYVGLNRESSVYEWYPASANKNYGYFGWSDAEKKYYINTPEFEAGISETKTLYNAHSSFGSLTQAKKDQGFAGIDSDVKAWDNGKVGLRWGYTYEVPNMIDNDDFRIRFVGIPSMDGENARNEGYSCLVPDYLAIYKNSPNAELAYKFAKWMSYDPEGIAMRIQFARDDEETPNTLPMTTDTDILYDFEEVFPVKGVVPFYERLADSVFEPTKVVPGYNESRFNASTGLSVTGADDVKKDNAKIGEYLDACFSGNGQFAAYAADLEALANRGYAEALEDYEEKY